MCVYLCIHMYVYMYVYMYIYICIYTYICIYIYIHTCTYIHIYNAYIWICKYLHIYIQAVDQEIKKKIELNRLKVQGRRDLLGDKELKKKLKEEEAEVADSRRLEALVRLAQQVPYFDSMQRVKANLAHLTASAKGHEYQPALEEEGRGHLPLNGFTDTKVISDARFRLAAALRQAGVQHTDAARHAVAAMYPRPQLSIHGLL
jgi:hypothetical protein